MLRLDEVSAGAPRAPLAVRGVSLQVERGRCLAVLGPNACGKSELLHAIAGLLRVQSGAVELDGRRIDGLAPHRLARLGIALVPAQRHIFGDLTVQENLTVVWREAERGDLEQAYELFPILGERRAQRAGLLSGGEQQQLAIARALMMRPSVLLLDEPSIGLSPIAVHGVYERLQAIRQRDVAIVVVEQVARLVLDLADDVAVMRSGEIVHRAAPSELTDERALHDLYFGKEEIGP